MLEQKNTLSSYMTDLLSRGRIVFSREEAQEALGVGRKAFLDAAERQQHRKRLLRPRQGFYTIVPPEYLMFETPPLTWYIDGLMRHEGRPYYVALLKAAQFHGAAHQAAMEFQVITDRRLPRIRVGRAAIGFYYRKDMNSISKGIAKRKTPTGFMKISSVELTVLDLLRYRNGSGGLDNIATILSELGEIIDPHKLAQISSAFERSVVQRLGYLLDWLGFAKTAEPLHASISGNSTLPWVELEAWRAYLDPELVFYPVTRNQRWKVVVRREPEPED